MATAISRAASGARVTGAASAAACAMAAGRLDAPKPTKSRPQARNPCCAMKSIHESPGANSKPNASMVGKLAPCTNSTP